MRALITSGLCLLMLVPVGFLQADDSTPPSLPQDAQGNSATSAPEDVSPKANVDVPSEAPQAVQSSVEVHQDKQSRFRWGNFILGAFGGAILVGGVGLLFGAADNTAGAIDSTKIGILCGSGAVAGGLLSLLLGATGDAPVTPPDMKSALPTELALDAPLPADSLCVKIEF